MGQSCLLNWYDTDLSYCPSYCCGSSGYRYCCSDCTLAYTSRCSYTTLTTGMIIGIAFGVFIILTAIIVPIWYCKYYRYRQIAMMAPMQTQVVSTTVVQQQSVVAAPLTYGYGNAPPPYGYNNTMMQQPQVMMNPQMQTAYMGQVPVETAYPMQPVPMGQYPSSSQYPGSNQYSMAPPKYGAKY